MREVDLTKAIRIYKVINKTKINSISNGQNREKLGSFKMNVERIDSLPIKFCII